MLFITYQHLRCDISTKLKMPSELVPLIDMLGITLIEINCPPDSQNCVELRHTLTALDMMQFRRNPCLSVLQDTIQVKVQVKENDTDEISKFRKGPKNK